MSGRRPDATKAWSFVNHFREAAVGRGLGPSHCRFVPPTHPLHARFTNIFGTAVFLKRQCDRTLGRPPVALAAAALLGEGLPGATTAARPCCAIICGHN
jgi:hypothetical protein